MLDDVTPLVITYNEAPNVARTLAKLTWANRIVVIDSGSTDETLAIVGSHSQAEVIYRRFDDFASQCNFGLTMVRTTWVLSLDADYELSDDLLMEMKNLIPTEKVSGYLAPFIYRIHGRPLRGTLYPDRVVLYRKSRATYRKEGHGHRVVIDGEVQPLQGVIYHDDRKSIARWFASQQRYATEEAEHLFTSPRIDLTRADRIRLAAWPAPIAAFVYTLLIRGCILDGWAGWYYALQRMLAETLIAIEIIDRWLRWKQASAGDCDPRS
jgi:glycosyltransferase involved in cell wall biosynthesis